VLGNHEMAALDEKVLSWHKGDVKKAIEIAIADLSEDSFRYIRECRINISDSGCFFVHGFPPDSCRLYLHQAGEDQLRQAFTEMEEALCFVGHTHQLRLLYYEKSRIMHQPLDQAVVPIQKNRKYFINVGSVGQPRDGDIRARYVIWDAPAGRLEIRAVEYDSAAAARKIIAAGIPPRFAALIKGER
jgi:diadenosine tetraphosphatase ApaH/serine/threonine PP2A family protein phosphatase